jgi:hypothetical protein
MMYGVLKNTIEVRRFLRSALARMTGERRKRGNRPGAVRNCPLCGNRWASDGSRSLTEHLCESADHDREQLAAALARRVERKGAHR